ncbi:MAG: Fic family protein [Saprospiraceae bacterium]|nr:Fic family protein [Saprospiraceae bacterium]
MKELITNKWFDTWKSMLDVDIATSLDALKQMELQPHSFTFYTSVSVMSSSKIEGEQMEVDSYVKHKMLNIAYLPELIEKPNDLYNAYLYAKENRLNKDNFHLAHKLIAAHLLPENQRGVLRKTEMLVMEHKTGRIQYEAALLTVLKDQYTTLWKDIARLLKADLSDEEIFYHASFIHLVFVDIHPFGDGNGRIGRLLEKWFLAEKLGESAWYIQSEKYYYRHVNEYYHNLARIGMFYNSLDYQKAIPFMLMLPKALINHGE